MATHVITWRTAFAVATVSAALGASMASGVEAGGPRSAPAPPVSHVHLLPYLGPVILHAGPAPPPGAQPAGRP
jgi:hypothetical protein